MKTNHTIHLTLLGLTAALGSLQAAPVITRLNPPSALFTYGDASPPYIARFLTGQRFDLQCTVQADPGQTITGGTFLVDGKPVQGSVSVTPIGSDRFSLALRAYSSKKEGSHVLTAAAMQSGGQVATAKGNFEIVDIKGGGRKAKNIIYLIGDGLGIAHRTAARIITGNVKMGKAESMLAMDSLPSTAMLMTHSLNSIVTDSAPGAACYSTGNKSNNNQQGVFPDDTTSASVLENKWDNPRVEHMGSYLARTQGKALGIVTTADVEDATPASFAVHTQDRGAGTGICDMFLDEGASKANLRVLMGGGRKWFLPAGTPGSGRVNSATASGADYVLPADVALGWGVPIGAVDPGRNLIADFQAASFTYVGDATAMNAVPAGTSRLLGLFNTGNMDIAMDKSDHRRGGPAVGTVASFPDQPMLDEMTGKALEVLNNNRQGFVLMVEGASIDKQAHNMDTERWVLDTVEFDRAVARCLQFQAANPDTLIIVTADHECAGINIIGSSTITDATLASRAMAQGGDGTSGGTNGDPLKPVSTDGQKTLRNGVVGVYEVAGFPQYTLRGDGYPETMNIDYRMLIGYAGNADRYEDWRTNTVIAAPTARDTAGDYFITGQVGGSSAVHTASDIPLSAGGVGEELFRGVMDNTDVFFRVMQATIGGAKSNLGKGKDKDKDDDGDDD